MGDGAHLVNTAAPGIEASWWRDANREVDFVLSDSHRVLAIEVGSDRVRQVPVRIMTS